MSRRPHPSRAFRTPSKKAQPSLYQGLSCGMHYLGKHLAIRRKEVKKEKRKGEGNGFRLKDPIHKLCTMKWRGPKTTFSSNLRLCLSLPYALHWLLGIQICPLRAELLPNQLYVLSDTYHIHFHAKQGENNKDTKKKETTQQIIYNPRYRAYDNLCKKHKPCQRFVKCPSYRGIRIG